MKKKLLLSLIFLASFVTASTAQSKNGFTYVKAPDLTLNDYQHRKTTKYKSGLEFQFLTTQSKDSNPMMQSKYGPADDIWIGETQTSVINFKKLMISTNYDFDVNGNLRRTTTNIRLNKLISYRIF